MPATSAVFLVELIGILVAGGFVAEVRTVVAISVSFGEFMSYRAALAGARAGRVGPE